MPRECDLGLKFPESGVDGSETRQIMLTKLEDRVDLPPG